MSAIWSSRASSRLDQSPATSAVPIKRPYWDARKNELIISRTVDKIETRYDLNVSFHIAFGDIEGLHGKPVVESIDYLSAILSSFLTGMESDIKRILCGESF
jgi:hypothetical protein